MVRSWRDDRFFERLGARLGFGLGLSPAIGEPRPESPIDAGNVMGGQPVTYPEMRDYDVPDTVQIDHNQKMPYHEGAAEIGEIELEAEVGQSLKTLTEEQPQAPLSQHEQWSQSYADDDGVHLGQKQAPWVAVDLDGTILDDPPPGTQARPDGQLPFGAVKPDAARVLAELAKLGWRISIYTARFGDERLSDEVIQRWAHEIAEHLKSKGVPFSDVWVGRKPRADYFVDDKAIRFDGDWAAILEALTLVDSPPRVKEDDTFSQDGGAAPFDYVEDPNDFNDPLGDRADRGIDRPRDLEGLQ